MDVFNYYSKWINYAQVLCEIPNKNSVMEDRKRSTSDKIKMKGSDMNIVLKEILDVCKLLV